MSGANAFKFVLLPPQSDIRICAKRRNSANCHCSGAQCREPRQELNVDRRVFVAVEPRLLLRC